MRAHPVPFMVAAFLAASLFAQGRTPPRSVPGSLATVELLAFDTNGNRLGPPNVILFESEDRKNLASSFRSGVADRIPFGLYRLKAHLPGFYSEVRYVRVYRERTVVLLGLEPGYEASPKPPALHGHFASQLGPPPGNTFVKLAGVYSSVSMESTVDADGRFAFAGVPWGRYVLLVLSGQSVLASRFVSLPQDGPDIEVDSGRHAVAPVHGAGGPPFRRKDAKNGQNGGIGNGGNGRKWAQPESLSEIDFAQPRMNEM